MNVTILGAGLAGLSCSFHLGHENCILFEANSYAGGHIFSHQRDGFTWDEGPHVSFTQHPYVRELFEESVQGGFLEYEVNVSNYYKGHWIPHPAQSNLWAVPEPIRSACLDEFLKSRNTTGIAKTPANYAEWLEQAFGKTFAETFPAAYTRKYWTCDPKQLATDWVGDRVFYPDIETVRRGYTKPPERSTHYIKTVRYPTAGGYIRFADKLKQGANIHFGHSVCSIDFRDRLVTFTNGKQQRYDRLISTLPLPELIRLAVDVPKDVAAAANALRCSSLLLVNVTANHVAKQPYHWMYVYDEDKLSTRINHIELLSPSNAPSGKTGIQVEVYGSPYEPLPTDHVSVATTVVQELREMGLIEEPESVHALYVPYANVIFDLERREAQDCIYNWLEQLGLAREYDDLDSITDWQSKARGSLGNVTLAGRFGQWKYFWTDDCVLRGRHLAYSRPS